MKRGETIVYSDGKEIARYKSVDESISEIEENVTSTLEEMRRNRLELEKHLRIMREEQESWIKRNRYEMEAARLRSKKKPSLKGVEPVKLNQNKRTVRDFGGSIVRSQYIRQQEEKARQAAEYLRVNQRYQEIKRREEAEKVEKYFADHLIQMEEAEAEADEIKIRYMKIMLGILITTNGVIQLLLGGSL